MVTETIKVDLEAAQMHLEKFKRNLEVFEPYTRNFTKDKAHQFTRFNADFIEGLKPLLNNMADDSGPEMLEEIKQYYQKAVEAMDTFVAMDTNLAEKMGD